MKFKTILSNIWKHLPITIGYMTVATISATLLFHFSNNVTNVSIIFILAIILVARATCCYESGILASLYSVFWVNYAFTYPFMELNFTLNGYPITFLGMTLISCFSSSICIMIARQSAQLQEKDRKLLEAEKEAMKTNLMRALSHDLRTPLTTIIGSSSTYLEQENTMSPEEKHILVENIEEDAQWLLYMVENYLAAARILDERGVPTVAKSEEPLEEVISESVLRFRKRFPQIRVNVNIPDSILMVPMDAVLIEQVINNLLENSLFHAQSSAPIDLNADTKGNDVLITIKDYGKGIAPELLDKLFDGGGIYKNQSGDGHKGMGIGLSLCKSIITAHGGTICASNHSQGAMFTFTLPDWREY